jgi:alkanesulfonate monooxygenase SsuD/methylene tetrahydromethanopterin reductase-like flavin-dependent oxidoreductase (luciferase family)
LNSQDSDAILRSNFNLFLKYFTQGRKTLVKAKFGLRIPSFPVDGSSAQEFTSQIIKFLTDLEQFFDSVWVDDHFIPWADFVPKNTPNLESFTTISYLSGVFEKITFGNIVLCNSYRPPGLVAKMGATLQTLTGGRFILGIGAGWKEDEYVAFGYEFPSARVRIEQLEESVQIIKKLWTEDLVTFRGKYYNISEAICAPKPHPIPPIMIGGGGEKLTLRVVACHADWWNIPNASVDAYKHKLKVLENHCKKVRREPTSIIKTLTSVVAIGETGKDAWALASRSPYIRLETKEDYIIGDPETVKRMIEEYLELGVQHFILRFVDFPKTDGAKIFAEKVMPKLLD